ncbi:hypothetical protein OBBRIDRAFT_125227 [Obba rivulosa]|uniref:Zn(2)-C6 fungal-type domain-containing protein n=1 Tax=Obba rivulosa TaxID=1052685 RepID=A0A8E2J4Q1_9APHY|nr:hypothetical protein OBBRIDRAFT_125227 [Obba rivulosa]
MPPQRAYSEGSDEDKASLSPESQNRAESSASRRRSSRACDQCRRTKSKCERPASGSDAQPCRGCAAMGLSCTFAGPSHKRGPPKGYILALERRLHQVEALLGTIIASEDPRARGILHGLSHDQLASQIIHRVNIGPFGPKGRVAHPFGSTKEDFLASILTGVSDEVLESGGVGSNLSDPALISPTTGWQDSLQRLLMQETSGNVAVAQGMPDAGLPGGRPGDSRSRRASFPLMMSRAVFPPKTDAMSSEGSLSFVGSGTDHMDWDTVDGLERFDTDSMDSEDVEAKQSLSTIGAYLNEHRQLIVSNHITGLHTLEQCRQVLKGEPAESLTWPLPSADESPPTDLETGLLPPPEQQDLLIRCYYESVHPIFPIIDTVPFTEFYRHPLAKGIIPDDSKLERTYFRILLLSMFSVASRHMESSSTEESRYATEAIRLITALEGRVHPVLCQALLLLAYRDIGVDALEKAWASIGSAIRMAQALGVNLIADDVRFVTTGSVAFSSQTYQRIWAGCIVLDRYISVLLGRPMAINLPENTHAVIQFESLESQSQINPHGPAMQERHPDDAVVLAYFNETCSLSAILGSIADELYMTAPVPDAILERRWKRLLSRLSHWLASLPIPLQFDPSHTSSIPPAYVLHLHMQYWWTLTLLHRAVIRDRLPSRRAAYGSGSPMSKAAFAASRVWLLLALWVKHYSTNTTSPFISGFILGAGVVDLLMIVGSSNDANVTSALRRNLNRMREMEATAGMLLS